MGDVVNLRSERTHRSVGNALEYINEQNSLEEITGFAFVVMGRTEQNMQGVFLEDMSKDAKLEMIVVLEMMKQSLLADL